ncbi:endonuclease domain-containing protein [Sphingorhabdus sp. Alg239-R122]|uniref:endonuclease domain-containing protein n=1 Tax=Sphingorhabdus sp. Alg239-R122 TaxID=2305989 RepID=UPI0013D9CD58|nr:endonuclease domain-containing protein [Sphingorhabdus sp. Alg239-R122]
MAKSTTGRTVRKARRLRREMTLPEVLLWQILRTKPMGIKFRRQHPVGPYILDFYCPSAKLAIEIDGIVHDMGRQPEYDASRDAFLTEQNIETIRIAAKDVLDNPEEVADRIVRYAETKL